MTLRFTTNQMQQVADARFVDRLRQMLLAGAPDQDATRAELYSPEGTLAIRTQIAHANRYGLLAELDVARYVATAWVLGSDFDVRFAAMSEILSSDRLSPREKAESLESVTVTLMKTLAEEEKE